MFYISAVTPDTALFFDSAPDSGYSVDNLIPGIPQGFAVAYNTGSGNTLTWASPGDPDIEYYRIYRDNGLVAQVWGAEWADPDYDGWDVSYEVSAVDDAGQEGIRAVPGTETATETPQTPAAHALHQNVPNRFNPSTVIRYDLPRDEARVRLGVYDVSGALVRTLVDESQQAGTKMVTWNGRDDSGRQVATGVYFYRLTAGRFSETRKMILLK